MGLGFLFFASALFLVFRFGGKTAGGIFTAGSLVLLAFYLFKSFGGLRHHGFIWIWFLVSLLIVPDSIRRILSGGAAKAVFLTLVIVQIPLGVILWANDLARPFVPTKAAAEWLLKEVGSIAKDEVKVGGDSYMLTPVVAYAGGRFFNVDHRRIETFIHHELDEDNPEGVEICPTDPSLPDIWMYVNPMDPVECPAFKEAVHFSGGIHPYENIWIYKRVLTQQR